MLHHRGVLSTNHTHRLRRSVAYKYRIQNTCHPTGGGGAKNKTRHRGTIARVQTTSSKYMLHHQGVLTTNQTRRRGRSLVYKETFRFQDEDDYEDEIFQY